MVQHAKWLNTVYRYKISEKFWPSLTVFIIALSAINCNKLMGDYSKGKHSAKNKANRIGVELLVILSCNNLGLAKMDAFVI